ncbi:zinc ABC transporter substrate-binding protein ZnuA [Magnetococcus sp. PR-3]|uniref:zinc ABC transporter substrate-binding protein ZnuA n=1 Tax=Magnetococcus sp. PR-3 TaxID=3120355 RepID=UPI002FCE5023
MPQSSALLFRTFFALISVLAFATTSWAAPRVVVSIKPIHSLVSQIMNGVGQPSLLLDGAGSPHSYALRPSQAMQLRRADLVFWMGEDLETFLIKPLATLGQHAKQVSLAQTEGIKRLKNRPPNNWSEQNETEDHKAHEDHDDHDDHKAHEAHHDHGQWDVHIWLDPLQSIILVKSMAKHLSHIDPDHKTAYEQNTQKLIKDLIQLDQQLAAQLKPIQKRPYIVFHDAYHYFEDRYGLSSTGALTLNPEQKPSAKRVMQIRQTIQSTGAICLFSEPQFEPAMINALVRHSDIQTAELDPLGSQIPAGPTAYHTLLTTMANRLNHCLSRP